MKKRRSSRKIRYFLEYCLFLLIFAIIRPLPHRWVLWTGRFLGSLAYTFSYKRRRTGRINLNIAFGNKKSTAEKNRILKASIIQLVLSSLQMIWVGINTEERIKFLIDGKPEGLGILNSCLEKGKGVFFLTAHYGNWEVMGINHGYLDACKLYSIARKMDNPYLENFIVKMREISGSKILYRDQSPIKIIRALKNNAGVAIMIDQNISKGGVFVDFFGIKAATTRAIHQLGYKNEVPVIPMFCYPNSEGKYKIVYGPELEYTKSDDKENDIILMTGICKEFLESVIKENPEHWMWIHRRWKTRPEGEKDKLIYGPIKKRKKKKKKNKNQTRL
jgi:KDO2-lipid IV(A) lauroyltransferase